MSEDPKEPTMKAGESLIGSCPACNITFQEKVETNVNHVCPNPQCKKTFCVMIFE